MKKVLAILLAVFSVPGMAQTQSEIYTLSGTVRGLNDGTVELRGFEPEAGGQKSVRTAKLTDGKFTIRGEIGTPNVMVLTINPGNWQAEVFIEKGVIDIQADTAGAFYYGNTGNRSAYLMKMKVTGPINAVAFDEYTNIAKSTKNRFEVPTKQLNYIRSFVAKNPSSVAGAYLLRHHIRLNGEMPVTDMEQLTAQFKAEARQSSYFSEVEKEIIARKAVLPGNFAENFTLRQRDSTAFTLSSTKGKYVMLDFWASWCKPCRAAIPHWKDIYAKYKNKGFEIIGIANDSRLSDWHKALDDEKMPWIQVVDEFPVKNGPATVISKYKHPTIPLYVLLDKEGRIMLKTGDKGEIDQKLVELLGS